MKSDTKQFWNAIALLVGVSIFLFVVGALRNQTLDYWYLPYNLALGVIPFGLALWAVKLMRRYSWQNWRPLLVSFAWLLFLPNSFYIVTDFIHLPETIRADIVQDSVMIMLYSLLGGFFGFSSLYMLHKEYLKHIRARFVTAGVVAVLFLASFAIYLGRELRWNSWDIISNPIGLFGDVLSIVFQPFSHPAVFWMTGTFLMTLVVIYTAIYWGMRAGKRGEPIH